MTKKVGDVIHYFDKIGVAIIRLAEPVSRGDRVKFVRGGEDLFDQEVDSIQVEHQSVDAAQKGDEIGVKVAQKVKEGAEVFLEE
ncbi:MAG: hypothetical protein HY376_03790 [Candidatus Blackburnbacteria bacterium]|nr:hypothetical protein [Candidatus Blackburnbacteria bacterium]